MNNLKKYLILLELMSFKRIDLDIIKKKYRELAMRFHPDITGRDTNKEMAEINNAYEYLIRNISAANEELKNIWREKEAEFARIYRDAIIKDLSSATISQLRRSINLFNTISGYKDVEDLINKYTTQLNKLLKEEARKESIYKQAILDIRNATMKELEEAISLLKTIPNYKDSNNLILIYSNQIEKIKEEIKKNESYYKQIQKIKNDSITDSELEKIIRFLNTYNVPGSEELLNHFYHRQNQFLSIEKRLENERNEKIYVALLSTLGKAKTIKDFKEIISKYTKIKNYKNVSSILLQCEASIQNIIEQEEYERKDKIYNEAIEYLKQSKDIAILQKAIDLLKTIRDFKEAEVLITKAVSLIFDNNEEIRKSKIYDRGIIGLNSNDFNHLEALLKELNTVDNYKDIINLKEQYNQKIDKLKETIYQQANIDIKNASIPELEKAITTLNRIIDYRDSKKLIEIYNKKISSIKLEEEEKKKANLEEVYLNGLISDEEKITENLLKNKIKTLSGIENYKDSKKIIQSYKKYLNELAGERRKNFFLIFLKFYSPGILALCAIIFFIILPFYQLNKGISLFKDGQYEAALAHFEKSYKSQSYKYILAIESIELLNVGAYEEAIEKLKTIDANIYMDYDETVNINLFSNNYDEKTPPKSAGYIFNGWELKSYDLNINEGNFNVKIYLRALWDLDSLVVNFKTGGGLEITPITFNIETETFKLPETQKVGYKFVGWFTTNEFNDDGLQEIVKGTKNNITLYAKWEALKFDVTLVFNDQENTDLIYQIEYDKEYKILNEPKRVGYSFVGWFDINGNRVLSNSVMNKSYNHSLYAKWEALKFDVTLVYNDQESADLIYQIEYDEEYKILNEPKREGYSFVGWFDIDGNRVLSNSVMNKSYNHSLYAKWEINIYKVSLNLNGGTLDSTNSYYFEYLETIDLILQVEKLGYLFDGWYFEHDFVRKLDDDIMPSYDIILYAKWILDDLAFSISLIGESFVNIERNENYVDLGVHANYSYSDDVPEIEVVSNLNINVVGNYEISYGIKDFEGTVVKKVSRFITVIDTIPPVLISEYNIDYVYDFLELEFDEEFEYYSLDNGLNWSKNQNANGEMLELKGYTYATEELNIVVKDSSSNLSPLYIVKIDNYKPIGSFFNYRSYDSYSHGLGFTTAYQVDFVLEDNEAVLSVSLYFDNKYETSIQVGGSLKDKNGRSILVYDRFGFVKHNQQLKNRIKIVVIDKYGNEYIFNF